MTRISFDTYYDTYFFECTGHTEYASAGQDILCSAVSILCYTLRALLRDAYEEGKIDQYREDFSAGYARIDFELLDDNTPILDSTMAILRGFQLLEEAFPDFIEANV